MHRAALVVRPVSGWAAPLVAELHPGAYVAVVGATADDSIEARRAGLSVRDAVLALLPGPTCEIVMLYRAPVPATIEEQVGATGSGVLNVDACCVGTTKRVPGGLSRTAGTSLSGSKDGSLRRETGREGGHNPNIGRWPSNLALVHAPGCWRTAAKRVVASIALGGPGRIQREREVALEANRDVFPPTQLCTNPNDDADDAPAAEQYTPGCPVVTIDRQSGTTTSRVGKPRGSMSPGLGWEMTRTGAEYADVGGASRFYPQLRDASDLIAWFERLLGDDVLRV